MSERVAGASRTLEARWLGTRDYAEALELQRRLVDRRRAGEIVDQLLLLEHPPVITLGSSSIEDHLLADPDELDRSGIELFRVGRGGDVTYHGPGQLVGYPILDLKPDRRDLHRYLRDLEQVLLRTLESYGVAGSREPSLTGVWVGGRKIAAIGVRVASGWITSHGFALNVSTDLSKYDTIVPCGIAEREVTSLAELIPRTPTVEQVSGIAAEAFAEVFDLEIVPPEALQSL